MQLKFSRNPKNKCISINVYKEKEKIIFINKEYSNKEVLTLLKDKKTKGEIGSIEELNLKDKTLYLVFLKKEYKIEEIRKSYSNLFSLIKKREIDNISIEVPDENESTIKAIVEGLDLTDYKFDKYMSEKKKHETKIEIITKKEKLTLLKETLIVNRRVKLSRDLVNENSYIMTPTKLEEIVAKFSKANKLKFKSLNKQQIKKEGLNLLYAVGKGSENEPRLIICEYNGDPNSKNKVALVGKGITFDTGGINLKPSGYLEDMKTDMGGAAMMIGTFMSAVELNLKKNIILVVSAAENAISGTAFKPGDIFVSHKGVSVEIGNTDAEGRLVLGDAISYVQKYHKPTEIIDAATLTGACLIALGPSLIAMLGNDKNIMKKIFESGEKTSERVWELPIYDEHREMIKGKFSDIKNIGGREGGTITAAAFIEKFIDEKVKWTHLDIAGAARSKKADHYIPEYGTGRGVRLLVDYLRN